MNELYSHPDQYQPYPKGLSRQIKVVEQLVASGQQIVIEGPPLYVGESWSEQHSFGYHHVFPWITEALSRLGCNTTHIALVDDFTGVQEQDSSLLGNLLHRPSRSYFESEFADQAEDELRKLNQKGNLILINNQISLNHGFNVPLKTISGRSTCELLDACFQLTKSADIAIIIHPIEFKKQQAGMRAILQVINGGQLPFEIINIFTKNSTVNRIDHTDRNGQSEYVYGYFESKK